LCIAPSDCVSFVYLLCNFVYPAFRLCSVLCIFYASFMSRAFIGRLTRSMLFNKRLL
jgi:hypothetical protein